MADALDTSDEQTIFPLTREENERLMRGVEELVKSAEWAAMRARADAAKKQLRESLRLDYSTLDKPMDF